MKIVTSAAVFAAFMLSPLCAVADDDVAAAPAPGATRMVDVDRYVKSDTFYAIKISPRGDYYAATVPLDDGERTALVITNRANNSVTATFVLEKNTHVHGFAWVSPERVLLSMAEKIGMLDKPQPTGELYAINADGTQVEFLVGQRVRGSGLGTRIQPKKVERVAAVLVDDLPNDDQNVIISVIPFNDDPYTRAELMDVYSGRRVQIASAPVRRASFVTDNQGVVRFAFGADTDNAQRLYYRRDGDSEWQLLNDEAVTGLQQIPVGFSADNATAYLVAEQASGPNAIIAFDRAPIAQPAANRRRGFMASARFKIALASVPITKPACTAIVSQALAPAVKWNSRAMAGDAAVAENHSVMPRNCAVAIRQSIRDAICGLR